MTTKTPTPPDLETQAKMCPCISWARKRADLNHPGAHHPRCDGTGQGKAVPVAKISDDLENRAREFFAQHEHLDFYRAVVNSGYRFAADKQAEIMADFANKVLAERIEGERRRIANELDAFSTQAFTLHGLAAYIEKLRGGFNGES